MKEEGIQKYRNTCVAYTKKSRQIPTVVLNNLYSDLMEKKIGYLKRSLSFRSFLNHNNNNNSTHKPFKRSHSKRSYDIYFPYIRGPDVKPPRNKRRTLLLHKKGEQGYGFWLQTCKFTEKNGPSQKRTFVRHVEDEGPAYMAGLREGDVIVEVENIDVSDQDHKKIVDLISQADDKLRLVVTFTDAVRRVDLTVRLKKRQSVLKAKMEELERINDQEQAVIDGTSSISLTDLSATDFLNSADHNLSRENNLDNKSLSTSTESELSSISSSSDELIVRTSKFEKRSSNVLDSIKELNCTDQNLLSNLNDNTRTVITTENDLLRAFSTTTDYNTAIIDQNELASQGFVRSDVTRKGLRRVETMPAQKDVRRIYPKHEVVINLDHQQDYGTEYTHRRQYSNDSVCSGISDNSDVMIGNLSESTSQMSLARNNRPASYKMALKLQLRPTGDSVDF